MGVVCWGRGVGGVSCNVASAEEIVMYLLDRCELFACEGSLVVCAVAGLLCVAPYQCVGVGGWGGVLGCVACGEVFSM